MRVTGFREWSKSLLKSAKDRGIKLTNKNIRRLKEAHFSWAMDTYGATFGTTFAAVYNDAIEDVLLHKGPSIFDHIKKDYIWEGSTLCQPEKFGELSTENQ